MNNEIILYNIKEAREQLEEIEELLIDENLSEINFETQLEHTYHHLNFAWNIRHSSTEEYKEMSEDNFKKWSKFPKEIKPSKVKK